MKINNRIEQYRVRFSDDALEDVCLAALEAYACGDGRMRKGEPRDKLETFGHLWGHMKWEDGVLTFHVAKATTDISARRHEDWTIPHMRSGLLKKNFMNSWAPQLIMIGDYHSHPYDDLAEVQETVGYEFSECDKRSLMSDETVRDETHDNTLNVVVTICRIARIKDSGLENISDSVVTFNVGEYRFWVNAMIASDFDGERSIAPDDGREVIVDLDSRFYNNAAWRLEEAKNR